MSATGSARNRREGDVYHVTEEEIDRFRRDGYVHLRGVLSEQEVAALEPDYERFLRREIEVPDKDFCDMAGDYSRPVEEFSLINVMVPRRHYPPWQDGLYERRAASIARQLHGDDMVYDYDQLLAKPPFHEDAIFEWHQDLAYWPVTPDTRTATLWLALDASTPENGCMRFVPGSHREPKLREHTAQSNKREDSHTISTRLEESDEVRCVPILRGDATVHGERVLHGSGGNISNGWRRAYVVAFRSAETVKEERRQGFTHSHNDSAEVLGEVGKES